MVTDGWTWLLAGKSFLFRREIQEKTGALLKSSIQRLILFAANFLRQELRFFCFYPNFSNLKAWLLRNGLHWKKRRPRQVIRIWGEKLVRILPGFTARSWNNILILDFWWSKNLLASNTARQAAIAKIKVNIPFTWRKFPGPRIGIRRISAGSMLFLQISLLIK